ncbi:MAG: hypothetical protein U1F52_21620 [Burkholderiales bacterium]
MSVRIINPASRTEYILKEDRDSDKPTIFVLRPLTWLEMGEYLKESRLTLDQSNRVLGIKQRADNEERALSAEEDAEIEAIIGDTNWAELFQSQRQDRIAVAIGLVEVRGLIDQDGKPYACAPVEFAQRATPSILNELCLEILRLSKISEYDQKN